MVNISTFILNPVIIVIVGDTGVGAAAISAIRYNEEVSLLYSKLLILRLS